MKNRTVGQPPEPELRVFERTVPLTHLFKLLKRRQTKCLEGRKRGLGLGNDIWEDDLTGASIRAAAGALNLAVDVVLRDRCKPTASKDKECQGLARGCSFVTNQDHCHARQTKTGSANLRKGSWALVLTVDLADLIFRQRDVAKGNVRMLTWACGQGAVFTRSRNYACLTRSRQEC